MMMYTYLENIDQVRTRYNFPYNLIGKIKNIEYCDHGRFPFYKFTIYNDGTPDEYTCIINERHFDTKKYTENSAVVIEYAELKSFVNIGHCLLIRNIQKPVFNLTGNKHDDILILLGLVKKLLDSELTENSISNSYLGKLNTDYLKYRKHIIESKKVTRK